MKRFACCLLMTSAICVLGEDLSKTFAEPPSAARMWTWWFWLGNKVDKAGLTADLAALKEQGLGGVTVYSLSGPGVAVKGCDYMGPEWRGLWRHTVAEAERLGLGVSAMLCSGWNAGGPWITPEHASKKHVQVEFDVEGRRPFRGRLPLPPSDSRYYRDIAIQAFPVRAGQGQPVTSASGADAAQALLSIKAAKTSLPDGATIHEICTGPLKPIPEALNASAIPLSDIVDLSQHVSANGVLEWDVPEGTWRIVRTGYTLTGLSTFWSAPGGTGLECDPLDAQGMEIQFRHVGEPLLQDAGGLAGKVFRSVQIDSWEIGTPNWTPGLAETFKALHGYDLKPYVLALSGHIVGSTEITDRFLYDYRNTLGECVAKHYFGKLSALTRANGLSNQSEAGGVCCRGQMPMDNLRNLGLCDVPMGEFWQDGAWMEFGQNKNGKQTASAAHLYGKRIAAAEAFTSSFHWKDSPASLKPTADRAFCEGFNHLFIFSSATHSEDGTPGTEFCAGTHFNRKMTWWRQAKPFADYIARCSHLLQQGLFVADVLLYNGDGCPNYVPAKQVHPSVGSGYDYDVCNTEIILTRLSVRDGRIVLPDGMSYALMVLPERKDMPLEVLLKLQELVGSGMTLVGPKPEKDPSLKEYPKRDLRVAQAAAELWGACDGETVKEQVYGKGRVVWGRSVREVLAASGSVPDFTVSEAQPNTFLDWIHRRSGDTDIYFIANRSNREERAVCTFRVGGKPPERWNPVTGETAPLQAMARLPHTTSVRLTFAPYESCFVVFRSGGPEAEDAGQKTEDVQEITGPWELSFDPNRGGLAQVTFDALDDWTCRSEEGVKYYSGTAVYRTTFHANATSGRKFLDLGRVAHVATVRVNGRVAGTVWTSPYRLDVTGLVRTGDNALEVECTNLWWNRLVRDAALPQEKRLTQTNIAFKPDAPLMSSGLLGPVRVLSD